MNKILWGKILHNHKNGDKSGYDEDPIKILQLEISCNDGAWDTDLDLLVCWLFTSDCLLMNKCNFDQTLVHTPLSKLFNVLHTSCLWLVCNIRGDCKKTSPWMDSTSAMRSPSANSPPARSGSHTSATEKHFKVTRYLGQDHHLYPAPWGPRQLGQRWFSWWRPPVSAGPPRAAAAADPTSGGREKNMSSEKQHQKRKKKHLGSKDFISGSSWIWGKFAWLCLIWL